MAEKATIEDKERGYWDRIWASQQHYSLTSLLHIDLGNAISIGSFSFGKVISATISEDPVEFSDQVLRHSDNCPICGKTTAEMVRIAASLHPEFENGICNISIGVWAHRKCLDLCKVIDGFAPIPW